MLIQAGESEVLRDEITLLAHKATLAGVQVMHELYEDAVSGKTRRTYYELRVLIFVFPCRFTFFKPFRSSRHHNTRSPRAAPL